MPKIASSDGKTMKTNLTVFILIAGLLVFGGTVWAAEQKKPKVPPGIQGNPSTPYVPDSSARISNAKAASLVKKRYRASKIVGVSLLNRGGSPVYRVRTLSPKGVVKAVFVDGRTGEVFD